MPRKRSTRTPAQIKAARLAGAAKGVAKWAEMRAAAAGTIPDIDAGLARRYVKLLAAGLPAADAMLSLIPQQVASFRKNTDLMNTWVAHWNAHPLVVQAIEAGNGGPWESLTLEKRLDLALNHSFSQLAYFLYTTDFTQITDSATLKKLLDAREAVTSRMQGGSGSEDDLQAFMRDLTDKPDAGPLRFVPKAPAQERTDARSAGVRTGTPNADLIADGWGVSVDSPRAQAPRASRSRPHPGAALVAGVPAGSGEREPGGDGGAKRRRRRPAA